MAIPPLEAAKFVCESSGWSITNLSLQKILYFSHLVFLGENRGKPLFDENFEAWEWGPVLRSVYTHTKNKKVEKNKIDKSIFFDVESVEANDNKKEFETLAFLTKYLARIPPNKLVRWSHWEGGAWKKIYQYDSKFPIPNEDIKSEYDEIFRKNAQIKRILISSKKEKFKSKLILALDFSNLEKSREMIDRLESKVNFFKIGMEMFFQTDGIKFAQDLQEKGNKIFFDAKALDIPCTVEAAINSISELDFNFMSVHTLSYSLLKHLGRNTERRNTQLIGVTLLTSISAAELKRFGIEQTPEEMVLTLAKQAMEVGKLDGLVASGREVGGLRVRYPDAVLITPGIRPQGAETHDQRRTTTPREAIAAGADHIVVGRPITRAEDPCSAVEHILAEIEQGIQERELACERGEKHEQKDIAC